MQILDPRDNKTYNVENLRIVPHQLIVDGEKQDVDCVEYTVIGNSHNWNFWMKLSDFTKANIETAIKIKQ